MKNGQTAFLIDIKKTRKICMYYFFSELAVPVELNIF